MNEHDKELLKELLRLDVTQEDAQQAKTIFETCPDAADTLANPIVAFDEKRAVIERLFPKNIRKFILSTVKGRYVDRIGEILDEYLELLIDRQGIIIAIVRYVTPSQRLSRQTSDSLSWRSSSRRTLPLNTATTPI